MRTLLCAVAGACSFLAVVCGFAGHPGPAVAYAVLAVVSWSARVNFDYPDGDA